MEELTMKTENAIMKSLGQRGPQEILKAMGLACEEFAPMLINGVVTSQCKNQIAAVGSGEGSDYYGAGVCPIQRQVSGNTSFLQQARLGITS